MIFQHDVGERTLNLAPFFDTPSLPALVTSWSALIPLVCHLASYEDDHQMVGELALTGYLTVGIFPRLGFLYALGRLIGNGPEFLDWANIKGESSHTVWDVNWGSVFKRSNGAAASIVTKFALRQNRPPVRLPEDVISEPFSPCPSIPASKPPESIASKSLAASSFRRHQTLRVIKISRRPHKPSFETRFISCISSHRLAWVYISILLGAVSLLSLLGAYGTAAVVLSGAISKAVCELLRMQRPPGYLENNEYHDACMLSAAHDNASTWYLYIGDRGIVDWLLNKTMLPLPSTGGKAAACYFQLAHLFQLFAMTFVAAQKGIDGVSLVCLMLVNFPFQWLCGDRFVAKRWLDTENISAEGHTFVFSGRTPMLGGIHVLNGARRTSWMDSLLAPCPRRELWLEELKCEAAMREQLDRDSLKLKPTDRSWILLHSQLAIEAAREMRKALAGGK